MISPYAVAIRARISSTFQTVVRGPSFTGLGNFPDFTPAHQDDFLTGIIGGVGGTALGLPIICDKRKKPVSGIERYIISAFGFVCEVSGRTLMDDNGDTRTSK